MHRKDWCTQQVCIELGKMGFIGLVFLDIGVVKMRLYFYEL